MQFADDLWQGKNVIIVEFGILTMMLIGLKLIEG